MKKLNFIFISFVLVLTSCQSSPIRGSSALMGANSKFQLRSFQEETLANGMGILWIQDQSLPRLSMQMMVKVGSRDENPAQAGLNSMVSSLLDQGSLRRSAPEIAEDLAQIGAEFSDAPSHDQTFLVASGLSETADKLLEIFAEIILQPTFTAVEVERRRSVVLATLQKNKDQPSLVADQKLDEQIFSDHPYSRPTLGVASSVQKLKSMDLVSHYKKFYRPNNSILAISGQFDDSFKEKVRQVFASWEKQTLPLTQNAEPKVHDRDVLFVHKSGLQQTQIRWGLLGLKRQDSDFLTYRLANIILGGAFASRLNQKIRDDLGLTYSISSNSDARLEPGSIEISTFTRHDKAITTVLETEKLLKKFETGDIADEELKAAKALLIGQFPAALETVDRLAMNLLILRRMGVPDAYLQNFEKNVNSISAKDVSEAIRRHFFAEKLQLVIYSDESAISKDELSKINGIKKVNFQ